MRPCTSMIGTLLILLLLFSMPVTAADHIPEEPEPLLKLYLHYQDGTIHVNTLREDHGYFNPRLIGSGDFMARIVDADNETLYANDFDIDPSRTHGPALRSFQQLLIFPRPEDSQRLILYHDYQELATLDVPGAPALEPDPEPTEPEPASWMERLDPLAFAIPGLLFIIVGAMLHRREQRQNKEDPSFSFWD